MNITVIIPAAGTGTRFGPSGKIEFDLAGKPIFLRTIDVFANQKDVEQIILAVNPSKIDEFKFRWQAKLAFFGITLVSGGRTKRWQTVRNALAAVSDKCTHVAVHDAARPLASEVLVKRVFDAAMRFPAVIPAIPINATLKRVEPEPNNTLEEDPLDVILSDAGRTASASQRVRETIDRNNLVEVQTPQIFAVELLRRGYEQAEQAHNVTDDAGLIEALGEPVHIVEGESTNLKITHSGDAEVAAAILENRQAIEGKFLAKKRLFAEEDD